MKNLRALRLHSCPLRELPFNMVRGLDSSIDKGMLQLDELELYRTEVSEVSFPKGVCSNLQHLMIRSCNNLAEVGALPTTLTTLDLRDCPALKNIAGLCDLDRLRKLDRRGCTRLTVKDMPGGFRDLTYFGDDNTSNSHAEGAANFCPRSNYATNCTSSWNGVQRILPSRGDPISHQSWVSEILLSPWIPPVEMSSEFPRSEEWNGDEQWIPADQKNEVEMNLKIMEKASVVSSSYTFQF
jgi:hypothetical protein